jgi:hypothetical protein
MTFLVNNDYELPEEYIVIRNENKLPEHEFFNKHTKALFNPTEKINPVAFITQDTKITNSSLEAIVIDLFSRCPEIGFVYTDALIKTRGQEFVDFFSGRDLPDESFFANLTIPINFDEGSDSKIRVMQYMMQANRLFIHLPDPLITVYK